MSSKQDYSDGPPRNRSLSEISGQKERSISGRIHVTESNLQALSAILNQLADEALAEAESDRVETLSKHYERDSEKFKERLSERRAEQKQSLAPRWHVELSDNMKLGPMSLGEFLQISNTKARRIKSVTIRISEIGVLSTTVQLRRTQSSAFSYALEGQASIVEKYAQRLDEFIHTIRPVAYWFPALLEIPVAFLFSMVTGLVVATYLDIFKPETIFGVRFLISVFGVGALLLAASPVILPLVRYLFPSCEISIGKETEHLAFLSKVRWVVLSIIISLVIGVFLKMLILS